MTFFFSKKTKIAPAAGRTFLSGRLPLFIFLTSAVSMWVFGSISTWRSGPSNYERPPLPLSHAVYELDSAVHRLLASDSFGGDDVFELERAKVVLAIERLAKLTSDEPTLFHASVDVVLLSARQVLHELEQGDKKSSLEHIEKFREGVATVELGLKPVLDADTEARQDGSAFLLVAGLMLTGLAFLLLFQIGTSRKALELIKSNFLALDEELKSTCERLVVAENQLSATRGRVDYLLADVQRLEHEYTASKIELQRQMLARSASEKALALSRSQKPTDETWALNKALESLEACASTIALDMKQEMISLRTSLDVREGEHARTLSLLLNELEKAKAKIYEAAKISA
jgi:hypothetical protein